MEAGAIVACVVMESGRDLDQPVQESFSFSARVEPDGFQRLVRFKEFFAVEETNSPRDGFVHGLESENLEAFLVNGRITLDDHVLVRDRLQFRD